MYEAEYIGRQFIGQFITDATLNRIETTYKEYFKNIWVINEGIEYINIKATSNDFMRKRNQVQVTFEIKYANILEKLVLVHVIV